MGRIASAFADLSVRRKGLVIVAAPMLALLVVVIMPLFPQREVRAAESMVRQTVDVQRSLQLTLTLLLDAETGTRGYLLTHRREWLQPYEEAQRRLPGVFADLQSRLQDSPAQLQRLARVKATMGARMEHLVVLQDSVSRGETHSIEQALERSKASMDSVRAIFTEMQAAEEALRAERTARLTVVRGRIYLWILASVAVGLTGGLIGATLFGKDIAQRLRQLSYEAALLARRETLPPPDRGHDELGRLSSSIHEADRLLGLREGQLREAQMFLEHLVETSPTVIFRQDPRNMQITYVSPNAGRILGYSAAEMLGDPDFWPAHLHPDDRERVLEADRGAFASRAPQLEVEYRFRHKDGSYRWLDSFLHVEYDEAGEPVEFLGHRLDITDRKIAEEALREREAHLDAANKELQSFSYSVSHDLRAPLRSIDGFSLALIEDYGAQLDGAARNYLTRVRAATQRMGQLIDDLLNLARVSRSPLRRTQVDLSAMAQEVAADLFRGDPDRNVEFVIAPGLHDECDSNLLQAVLENLLGNSWKFTSKHPTARIEFGRDDGTYFVRDDGAGFDPAYKSKLFGAFQRLHHGADFTGTGIGLATVQRIVRRHGGTVWAESEINEGATFWFTLAPPMTSEMAPLQYAMRGPQ